MSGMRPIAVFLSLAISTGALASAHSTKWTLRNEARDPITVTCRNVTVDSMDIVLPEQTLTAGQQIVHDWGDRYYNDGLWLNPGKWSCAIRAESKKAIAQRTETFSTEWGEAITLVLGRFDNQLRLKKIPMKTPLATKDNTDGKDSK